MSRPITETGRFLLPKPLASLAPPDPQDDAFDSYVADRHRRPSTIRCACLAGLITLSFGSVDIPVM
jgi:hypothetical protein